MHAYVSTLKRIIPAFGRPIAERERTRDAVDRRRIVRAHRIGHVLGPKGEPLARVPPRRDRLTQVLLPGVVEHDPRRIGHDRLPAGMRDLHDGPRKNDEVPLRRPAVVEPRIVASSPKLPDPNARAVVHERVRPPRFVLRAGLSKIIAHEGENIRVARSIVSLLAIREFSRLSC